MTTKNTLPFVCLIILLTGIAMALPHTCIPGCCNGDLKDGGGTVKGSFSDWKAHADGTTDGSWAYDTAFGMVVSNNASGTYTYDPLVPSSIGVYTGTASFPSHPEYGTSSYTLDLSLTFPSPDYCIGDWSVDFDNSEWPDISGVWEHTSICASPMADHVFEIVIDSGIEDCFDSPGDIPYNFDIEFTTDDTVESITFTSPGTPGVASGITFEITKQYYEDPVDDIDAGYYHDPDDDTYEWWYFHGTDDPADFSKYGNGWYDITVYYTAGGSDSTEVLFNVPAENTPIPAPTQMPNITSHSNRQRTESPVTLRWDTCTDANVKNIWVGFEEMPYEDDIDIILPKTAVSTDPIALDDGYWEVMVGFDHYYNMAHNADGILYGVGRYTEKGYLIGVGIVSELSGDTQVNISDLIVVASEWLEDDCDDWNNYCDKADVNFDHNVDLADLLDLSLDWMKRNVTTEIKGQRYIFKGGTRELNWKLE